MKMSKLKVNLLLLLLTIPSFVLLFTNKGFSFHDETQIVNLHQYVKAFNFGQFPPRWAPDMHFTYGSPYLEFNYQLPYYLGVLFNKIGFSLLNSYKLCLATSLLLGAFGIFYFASQITSLLIGFAAVLLYTYLPYRAVDVYVRGTVGESFALGIYPWILYTMFRLKRDGSLINIIFFSLSVAGLILSHQPSTLLGLPFIVGIFILSELLSKSFKSIKKLFIGLGLSVAVSSYYLVPVLLEKKYIQDVIPFNFYDHFPFIKQLIYSKWGYGSSNWGPYDDMSFQLGFSAIFVVVIATLFLIFKFRSIKNKSILSYLVFSLISFIFVMFLMNVRSSFFWQIFPYTNSIQFPWRLLSVSAILSSLIFIFLATLLKGKYQKIIVFVVIALSLASLGYFHPGTIVEHKDDYYLRRYLPNQVLFSGEDVSADYLDYTENYIPLPKNAVRPNKMPSAKINSYNKLTEINADFSNPYHITATLNAKSWDIIGVNNFYYPGWEIKIDNKTIATTLDNNGAMLVEIGEGVHQLTVDYHETPIRQLSNIISLASLILMTLFIIRSRFNHG